MYTILKELIYVLVYIKYTIQHSICQLIMVNKIIIFYI